MSADVAKAKRTPAGQILRTTCARLKAGVLAAANWVGCTSAPVVAGQSQAHPNEIHGLDILILTLTGPGTSFFRCSDYWVVVSPAALVQLCLYSSWDASWSQPGQEQELY